MITKVSWSQNAHVEGAWSFCQDRHEIGGFGWWFAIEIANDILNAEGHKKGKYLEENAMLGNI